MISRIGTPVDGGSLAVARIAFGAVVAVSAVRSLAYGWHRLLYAGPQRFTYPGLGWVPVPTPTAAAATLTVIALAGVLVACGRWWRGALATLLVGFTWLEFVDAANYLNHYWFVSLFGLLLLAAPAGRRFAPRATGAPIAFGWVLLLRGQLAVVYCFAGIAKLNADWLLHGLPLRLWLPARADDLPLLAPLLREPGTAHALSWAAAAFDCTIVIWLSWHRTRLAAWLVVVAFHVATWRLFAIGVFPWVMIALTTVYFAPDWPDRLLRRPTRRAVSPRDTGPTAWTGRRRLVTVAAVVWMLLQVGVPLRHLALPGDARWTGEGYRFAWNVLRVEKAGTVVFHVDDGETVWSTDARDHYSDRQWAAMAADPELVRQAAHHIAERAGSDVAVRVDAFVSFNGRRATRLIDPTVDLAGEPWRWHQPWILPRPDDPAP